MNVQRFHSFESLFILTHSEFGRSAFHFCLINVVRSANDSSSGFSTVNKSPAKLFIVFVSSESGFLLGNIERRDPDHEGTCSCSRGYTRTSKRRKTMGTVAIARDEGKLD